MEFFSPVTIDKAKNMNPLVLAFVGDAVYTLYVRGLLALSSDKKVGQLNKISAELVRASSLAGLSDELTEVFTEEERSVFMRARNTKKGTRAKHSTVSDYNKSTGFEAVVGYLYLTGQSIRLCELLKKLTEKSM